MLHVLDFEGNIIDFISKNDKALIEVKHERNIKDFTEILDITMLASRAIKFKERNRVVFLDSRSEPREFIINRIEQDSTSKYSLIECNASYLEDIATGVPYPPQKLEKMTTTQALSDVLKDTGWKVSDDTEYNGTRTTSWTSYQSRFDVLKQLTTTYKMVMDFHIDLDSRKVKSRYVSLKEPKPLFKGKEIVRGKDLLGLKRTVDVSEVRTALVCLGPEKENGERIKLIVQDDEAQKQFGLPTRYIWDIYEPESEDENMTEQRLRTLGTTQLNKVKSAAVSYEVTSLDIKKAYPHEIIRLGDIVRVKDRDFTPALYVEGEVISETYYALDNKSEYTFGNYVEYKESDLRAEFAKKLDAIRQKLNDKFTNVNTIVADVVEGKLEYFERKIFKGSEPPENPVNDMLWLDTRNPDVAVLRRYWQGQWINATAEKAEDIGAITREKALYSELNNTFVNLSIQHSKLLNEMHELTNSEYLVDFDLKEGLNTKLDATVSIFNNIKSNLESMTDETATIGKLVDTQALFLSYREKLQALYNVVENAKLSISERIKLLQSQYTDEKYNEAMEKVASSINGTWNAETGQLVADVPNEARLTELRQQIKSSYDQELNSAMATLRNETDSKLVNTKDEISATVAKVDEKITGLTIGGRNLLRYSTQKYLRNDLDYSSGIVEEEGKRAVIYNSSSDIIFLGDSEYSIEEGETYTFSFYAKASEETYFYIGVYINGDNKYFNKGEIISTNWKRYSFTFTGKGNKPVRIHMYPVIKNDDGTYKSYYITDWKLEKGTVATDVTPAPEDLQNEIATTQANAEAASKAYADAQDALRKTELQAYADGIVTEEEQRAINDAQAKLQEAKTYAEQQKQIAIDTANENTTSALEPITVRTTNNENSIKTLEDKILLTATKEDVTQQLNTELQPIKTDVNDQKAQLQVMSDEISTKVSLNQYSSDQASIVEELSNAETERKQLSNQINDRVTITEYNSGMEEKTNEINTAVNNIKIGGVNMLDGTKDFTSPFITANIQKYGEVIDDELTSVDYDSVNNRLMWATFYTNIPVQPNTDYTISYDAKTKDGIAQGVVYTPITRLQDDGTDFNPRQYLLTAQTYKNTTNEFQRYSFTFNTGASKRIKINFTSKDVNSLTNIKKVKLELGNKATPYEQSPNDVTNLIAKARIDAEVAAKAYADAQDKLRKTEAQAYADGIVDAEEQRAIKDAQQKLAEAKADAQAKADTAESLAKEHADTQSAVAEQSAKAYADGLKQQTDQTLTTYDTRITQNGQEISQRATKEEFNQSRKTLSRVISELTNSTMDGLTYTYDENGAIQSFNVGPQGVKIKGDKVDIRLNKEFNLLVSDVAKKADETNIINKINLSREGLDINVNNIGIRGGDSTNYLTIKNQEILSRGIFTRTWSGVTDTPTATVGIKDGYILSRNEKTGYNLYMTEKGLSTMMSGGIGSEQAGALEFHYDLMNDNSRGVRLSSTYGVVFLHSEHSRVYTRSRYTTNIESWESSIYLRPQVSSRSGVNEFSFYIKDNDSAGDTDGTILFGEISDETGLAGSGIRFKKKGVRGKSEDIYEPMVYATDNQGSVGTGSFYAKNLYGNWKAKSTNLYAMVNGEFRVTDFNGANGTNGSINYAAVRIGNINSYGSYANHSGANVYFGVGTNELRVTNNNHYNGGNIGYRPVRASAFNNASLAEYKEDIKLWDYDALNVITKELELYQYKYKGDVNNQLNHRGLVIGDGYKTPSEFIFGDGVNLYEMITWALRAIQQLNEKLEALQNE